jgi:hypothetical protein
MAGTGTPVITKRGNSDNHGPCACPASRCAEVPQITPIRAVSKALAALTADRAARRRYLDNAAAGGAALWLYAPTEEDADRLVRELADYDYRSLRYYGGHGIEDILRDPG